MSDRARRDHRPLSRHGQRTRAHILETARRIFGEKGFDHTRVEHIAEAAGVNKTLVYYYFRNKAEILTAIVATLLEEDACKKKEFLRHVREAGGLETLSVTEASIAEFARREDVLKVLFVEALKNGGDANAFLGFLDDSVETSAEMLRTDIRTAGAVGPDGATHTELYLKTLFCGIGPLVIFALLKDDIANHLGMSPDNLHEAFVRVFRDIYVGQFEGMVRSGPSPN